MVLSVDDCLQQVSKVPFETGVRSSIRRCNSAGIVLTAIGVCSLIMIIVLLMI